MRQSMKDSVLTNSEHHHGQQPHALNTLRLFIRDDLELRGRCHGSGYSVCTSYI